MPKFPEPPSVDTLAAIPPELIVVPAATELWRAYSRGGPHPTLWNTMRTFGPAAGRFDHQLPPPRVQARSVVYLAEKGPTCLAEVFQDTRTIDREAHDPWLVAFETAAPIVLLDLTGSWPTRAGASMAINSGPRSRARRWARGIYDAYPTVQGIYYASSMRSNDPCIALWDRGSDAIPEAPVFHRPLIDPALLVPLRNAATDLSYGLV